MMHAESHNRFALLAVAAVVAALAAVATPATAQAQDDQAQDDQAPVEEKLETYWSVEREVPTIRQRLYERDGRVGIGVHVGLLTSEPFYWYVPVGGRLSYYFSNFYGLELEGSYMDAGPLRHNTELTDFLESEQEQAFDPDLDTEDRFMWRANALFVWHPLYGKLAFLQRKLAHFDFNLALGGGVVSVSRPDEFRTEATEEIVPELAAGGGVQFFATDSLVVRLDGRVYVYEGPATAADPDENFFDRLSVPTEFLLGATYMF